MRDFQSQDARSPVVEAEPAPSSCPTCRSSEIVTTAKSPDVASYWRCTGCGEVWNVSRRRTARRSMHEWR